MPELKIKGVEVKDICSISKELVDELQELLQCPRSYFTLECVNSTFVCDGGLVKTHPTIEVSWFDRGQELQDKAARVITRYVHNLGYNEIDVIFNLLEKNRYYEDGEHF